MIEGDKPIVVKTAAGGVAIIWRFPVGRAEGGTPIYPDAEAEIAKYKTVSEGEYASHREMDKAAIPADRTFRNAWCDVTPEPVIDVDMDNARNIHRERMRAARKPLLEALDVEYQRADERGDAEAKAVATARKQALRDVTADPAIDAANTPDELRAIWPAELRTI